MKMAMRRLAALVLAAPLVAAAAPAQDGGSEGSREQATLIDEQERLERKLTRLKEQMLALADRFEGEGRVHAAKLLRSGIEELDLRDESSESKTLAEVM